MKKIVCLMFVFSSLSAFADMAGKKARTIHDRIASVPPSPAVLNQMRNAINAQPGKAGLEAAAAIAIQNENWANVTLKVWSKTLTNTNESNRIPLNDMAATIVGAAVESDTKPFGRILWDDVLYTGANVGSYSNANNNHYEQLEASGTNLMTGLVERQQSAIGSAPAAGIAGILSSRAWAEAYYDMGTNRRATFYLLKNFMCQEMDYIMDANIPDIYVARDVTRSPAGDSSEYKAYCVGCHAMQDAMRPAWAYYDFDQTTGAISYTPGNVPQKLNRGANAYPDGYITVDDNFRNFWGSMSRHKEKLGFKPPFDGQGAADLGKMVAESSGFADCMTFKTFRNVCYRNPAATESDFIEATSDAFEANQNVKQLYIKIAAHCVEDKYESE